MTLFRLSPKPIAAHRHTLGSRSLPSAALLATLLVLAACGAEASDDAGESEAPEAAAPVIQGEAFRVRTSPVLQAGQTGNTSSAGSAGQILATGTVVSDQEAKPSFKTGGLLASVRVEEGDRVSRGQVIATINTTELDAGVAQAEAGLAKAERDLARVSALFADSVATRTQRDDASTGVTLARRQLDQIRFNRGTSVVRSPMEGRVLRKLANAGESVGPGQPVVLIQGTGRADWRIKVALTDAEWARVAQGDAATVSFDAFPGKTFRARVDERASAANTSGGTFDVELRLIDAAPSLAAGLLARVSLSPKSSTSKATAGSINAATGVSGLRVPLAALARVSGKRAEVFAATPDGHVKLLRIELGAFDASSAAVVSGLDGTERLVTTGATWLRDGDAIVDLAQPAAAGAQPATGQANPAQPSTGNSNLAPNPASNPASNPAFNPAATPAAGATSAPTGSASTSAATATPQKRAQ